MSSTPILDHLIDRHVNLQLHNPIVNEVEKTATFYLWNLSGTLCGYQQYRPFASKAKQNNAANGRYFTYKTKSTHAIFGIESLQLTPNILFLTEGIFDACRLTSKGISAVAVLSNNPTADIKNWLYCINRVVVAVCDNDAAGKKLRKFGDVSYTMMSHDLGECNESELDSMISEFIPKYGRQEDS